MRPGSRPTKGRFLVWMMALTLALGLAPVRAASADGWREYTSGGRQWREECETYSSTVERCRTEIWATTARWSGGGFVIRNGWTFNNLLYKPSNRADWVGNPLATPGEHTINGRRWKTECDTSWTGRHGCRSQIWAKVPAFNGQRYRFVSKWVFNNQVQFIPSTSTVVPGPDTVITPTTWAEVATTYTTGCPVGPNQLRTIRINHWDFNGKVQRGEIIVRADLANRVAGAFEDVFHARFPVAQMRNPNVWDASDEEMMAANNTSAFNCRRVVGNPTNLSPHSYGKAVDFNPVQNPYRDPTGRWWPSSKYSTNRPPGVPGLHTDSSASVTAFTSRGFSWFKGWDWHHFEYRGGAARTVLTADRPAPADTRSGDLDDRSLPQPDGWQRDVLDGSVDAGFTGNGTWLHAVDPATKGTDVLAVGCSPTTTDAAQPIAALEGNLTDDGRPGVSVALQFATEADAKDYFAAWRSQMQACDGASTTQLSATDTTWLGRWSIDGTDWAEAGGQRDDVVKLTLLDDDLTVPQLRAIAEDF